MYIVEARGVARSAALLLHGDCVPLHTTHARSHVRRAVLGLRCAEEVDDDLSGRGGREGGGALGLLLPPRPNAVR